MIETLPIVGAKRFLGSCIFRSRLGRFSETGAVWLIISRNTKWILAFALVFVYTSGVLFNASGLAQWYSTKLTEEFLGFTNIDFAIDQIGTPEMAEEVHGRIRALDVVRDVVSMIELTLEFEVKVEPYAYVSGIRVYAANGTGIVIWGGLDLTSYLGLEARLGETEPSTVPIPEPGMAVVSRELAEGLNIQPGGNLTMETPLGNVTFGVSGITELDHFAIWKKIEDPQALPSTASTGVASPSFGSSVQLNIFGATNRLVLLSCKDVVDLALAVGSYKGGPLMNIKHFVFCERKNLVEPANMDGSLLNFRRAKEKMELLTNDVHVTFESLILRLLEWTTPSLHLFSIIAFGCMLAALPLYWFVASTLISIFAEGKRREITLFRVKGMSARNILSSYIAIVLISAGLGSVLGAVLQTNASGLLMEGYAGWIRYEGSVNRVLGIVFPDLTSLVTLLILGLILGIIVVWRLVKSIVTLRPSRTAEGLPLREGTNPKRLSKLAVLLLAIGLVKVALILGGIDSTVYFKNPPPNPYVAMGLSLFATFDTYALNALAPVFIAYGFANLISTKPKLFSGLLKALSYSAGLKRRKISFKIISSEMWRVSGSFLLITLVVSYGVTSYVNYNSLTDHVWKMAGEFTGADIRIDCTPNVTRQVEEAVKNLSQVLDYARIDVMTSVFTSYLGYGGYTSRRFRLCTLMVIDPEQYNRTAYLDNAPELRSALTSLKIGSLIGLRDLYDEMKYHDGVLVTKGYLIQGNKTLGKEVNVGEWLDLPLPGAYENPETINVSSSPLGLLGAINNPAGLAAVYGSLEWAVFNYWHYGSLPTSPTLQLSYPLMRYTSEGLLWSTAGFATLNETLTDTSYEHVKTHFIIKLKPEADAESLAHDLRNSLTEKVIVITRADAADIIIKSIPRLAISLAFAQMNCILITAISLGSLAAVTVVNAAGRSKVLSLLRTRGAKKLDGIALFLPEGVLLSLLAGVMGVLVGVLLAVSYNRSLADLVPNLFTKGGLQLSYGWSTWIFLCLTLAIFILMHIIATAFPRKISRGVE